MSSSTSRSLVPMAKRDLSIKPASYVTAASSLNENNHQFTSREDAQRPRIVVFERRPGSKFKLRIFYLQLVMMAGR